MSEENNLVQSFEDWVEKSQDIMALMWLKNKITELEKKLEIKYENETGHALVHEDILNPRIEKLENLMILRSEEPRGEVLQAGLVLLEKDLAELKASSASHTERIDGMSNGCSLAQQNLTEIKELKEHQENIETWINTFNMALENRIVLKKFLKMESEWHITEEEEAKYLKLIDELGGEKECEHTNPIDNMDGRWYCPDCKEIFIPKEVEQEDTTELQTDPEWEKVRQDYFKPKEVVEDFVHIPLSIRTYLERYNFIAVEKEDLLELLNSPYIIRDKFRKKYLEEDKE